MIGHLRKPDEPMFWFSDNDKIFDGRCAAATQQAFTNHLTRMFGPQATAPITFMTPQMLSGGPETVDGVSVDQIRLAQERLLSIADLAAGTLAVSLPAPYSQGKEFVAPDPETRDILEALTHFGSPLERSEPAGKLLVLAIQPATTNDRLQIEGVALRRE